MAHAMADAACAHGVRFPEVRGAQRRTWPWLSRESVQPFSRCSRLPPSSSSFEPGRLPLISMRTSADALDRLRFDCCPAPKGAERDVLASFEDRVLVRLLSCAAGAEAGAGGAGGVPLEGWRPW